MFKGIIDLAQPGQTPAQCLLLDWESRTLAEAVVDVFGYHALQLGMPHLKALSANRMPHRWLALREPVEGQPHNLLTDFHALPFPDASLDLVVLPHALESDRNPHGVLREVARVLVPGGRVVITGLNPTSLWPWHTATHATSAADEQKIGYWRVRDWLRLLDFEVVQGDFGMFRPPLASPVWLQRWGWMERWGPRAMPMLGAVYVVTGIKQVRGMRLMGQPWRSAQTVAAQTSPAVQREAGPTLGQE
jgi:SAM-dependent methyltransferase